MTTLDRAREFVDEHVGEVGVRERAILTLTLEAIIDEAVAEALQDDRERVAKVLGVP